MVALATSVLLVNGMRLSVQDGSLSLDDLQRAVELAGLDITDDEVMRCLKLKS